MVVIIVARLTAKGEAEAEELLGIMAKAAASYRQDPGTLSWHIARGAKDKKELIAFERYESRQSIDAHTKNPNFKEAGAAMARLCGAKPDLTFYDEAPVSVPNAKL